ncbi:hypothetical protein D3C76_647170 [compost metagenome]
MNLDIGKPFVGRQAPELSGVDVRRHHVLGQTAGTEAGDDQSARKSSKRSEKIRLMISNRTLPITSSAGCSSTLLTWDICP